MKLPGHWLASPWRRSAVAALAGALPMFAFPAPSLWWFAYVALVPWILLVRSAPTWKRAAYDGWFGGFGFILAVHHWLLPSLHVFTLVIAALMGVLWVPWGLLVRRFLAAALGRAGRRRARRPAVGVAHGGAGPFVAGAGRAVGHDRLQPVAGGARAAAGVGRRGVAAQLPGGGCERRGRRPCLVRESRVPAVAGLVATAAVTSAAWVWSPRPEADGGVRIALVQPGIVGGPEKRFAREEALTRQLAGEDVDLIVWGESSVGFDLAGARPGETAGLALAHDRHRHPRQRGRQTLRPARHLQEFGAVGPDGPTGDRYDKMRLVPFGEYIPARSLLSWATSVGKAASEDRRRGSEQVVMTVGGGLRIGPMVCFESAFPDMSRHLAQDGADVLIAQSSTSTFQHSWAPEQHASIAALRAAETGLPMVHATLTGVSAVYGPSGERVGSWLGTDASTSAVYDVPLARGVTPYVRLGDWAVHGAVLVLLVLGGVEGARVLRRRRSAPAPHLPPARTVRESPVRPGR